MSEYHKDYISSEVFSATKHGDKTSLTRLISKYVPVVHSRARWYKTGTLETDDLFQEGMIGLLSAVEHYNEDSGVPFDAFAKLCIDRKILSALEASKTLKNLPLSNYLPIDESSDVVSASVDEMTSVEDIVEIRERVERVIGRIDSRLSERERTILMLYLDGNKYQEIAEILSVTPKSVDNALQRVRKKLK